MSVFSMSSSFGRVDRRWLGAALVYLAIVFFLSSRPYLHAPGPEFELKDNLAHAMEYGLLAILIFRGLGPLTWPDALLTFLLVVVLAASAGSADEMLQGMIPGRRRDVIDWVSDTTGAVIAAALCVLLARRVPAAKERAQ